MLVDALFTLALLASPVMAFVAGFYAGAIRAFVFRVPAVLMVVLTPLTALVWPLLVPGSTESDRYGAGMGLVLLGIPLALWTLAAVGGAFVGSARRRGPE